MPKTLPNTATPNVTETISARLMPCTSAKLNITEPNEATEANTAARQNTIARF
ncbi:hypothetical protein CPT_Maja_003 [Burkholderia phage Maja]|uniref:Uncharacterized protein n=1 Tax=Burkholderia phage Maja TaxID=2767571 RepID=A0A7S6R864_9CAUD|nr:hypothetical protein CPT_Maja_003 [Burkholderia phage Maja]